MGGSVLLQEVGKDPLVVGHEEQRLFGASWRVPHVLRTQWGEKVHVRWSLELTICL